MNNECDEHTTIHAQTEQMNTVLNVMMCLRHQTLQVCYQHVAARCGLHINT